MPRSAPAWPLVAAVAWTLFAFGGVYAWTLVPLAAVVAIGLLIVRPRIFGVDSAIDIALIISVGAVAAQLVPLPPAARARISPHAAALTHVLQVEIEPTSASASARPLTISPAATAMGVAYLTLLLAVFWLARNVFERGTHGAVRLVVRSVALAGLAVSVIAIIQLAISPLLIYGLWRPADASGRPFGPFVNRNHLATWLLLAIPLTGGHVMSHIRARIHGQTSREAAARALDSTVVWQMGAGVTMLSGLLMSLSRSGVIGLIAAAMSGFALARARLGRLRMRWIAGAAMFVLAFATYFANFDALAKRFVEALDQGNERSEIWRQTIPIVRDFALTGTGDGTFGRAMLVYQQGNRQLLFNQAHNQYLQIAAEGGLLVGLPALSAVIVLIVLGVRRLKRDTSALFWARAGAVAGIVAVGTQSLWETGLRMPANGVLFAICAALAVHGRSGDHRSARRGVETLGAAAAEMLTLHDLENDRRRGEGRSVSSQSSGRGIVSPGGAGRAPESDRDGG